VVYAKESKAGKFAAVWKSLQLDLIKMGLWSDTLLHQIVLNDGSIKGIPGLPDWVYDVYQIWSELDRTDLLMMAHARSQFIDQTQSLNVRAPVDDQIVERVQNYMMKAWKLNMKTAVYYFKSDAIAGAAVTIGDPIVKQKEQERKRQQALSAVDSVLDKLTVDQQGDLGACVGGSCSA